MAARTTGIDRNEEVTLCYPIRMGENSIDNVNAVYQETRRCNRLLYPVPGNEFAMLQ